MTTRTIDYYRDAAGDALDLLEAVEYDYSNFLDYPGYAYTGPALGTPELDALLLVAGQRWLFTRDANVHSAFHIALEAGDWPGYETTQCYGPLEWLLMQCSHPGHALARAIRDVNHA